MRRVSASSATGTAWRESASTAMRPGRRRMRRARVVECANRRRHREPGCVMPSSGPITCTMPWRGRPCRSNADAVGFGVACQQLDHVAHVFIATAAYPCRDSPWERNGRQPRSLPGLRTLRLRLPAPKCVKRAFMHDVAVDEQQRFAAPRCTIACAFQFFRTWSVAWMHSCCRFRV